MSEPFVQMNNDGREASAGVDPQDRLSERDVGEDLLRAPLGPPVDPALLLPPGAPFADGAFERLHPNYVPADRIGWFIFAGIIGVAGFVAFLIVLAAMGVGHWVPWLVLAGNVLLAGAALFGAFFVPRKTWETTSYAVSELGLEIHRGIWWKHVIDVPRSRIQHTDVQQGPLARHFGIGKLVVYTAGTQHASVELDGLEHGRAIQVRDFLLRGGEGGDAV